MTDNIQYIDICKAEKQAEKRHHEMLRDITLASIDGYVKAIGKFTKCKQDARDMHAMATGQIYLAKILDLITAEEKETLLQQIADAYGEALHALYD